MDRNTDDRATMSRLLKGEALTDQEETAFQRDMFFAPGWRDWRRDFIKGAGGPPNLDAGGDYNYRLAWALGAKPEYHEPSDAYHGMSSAEVPPYRDPVNFKSDNHPTMWKEDFYREFGFDPDANDAPWTEESAQALFKYLGAN